MGNNESPSELPQDKTIVESCSSESSAPAHPQIKFECSDDSPAAAKPFGAFNAKYNLKGYAGNNAAEAVYEKFSLTSVHSQPYLSKCNSNLLKRPFMPLYIQLPMFYSEMGGIDTMYNQRAMAGAPLATAMGAHGGQENEPLRVNIIELEEKFEVSMYWFVCLSLLLSTP